MNSIKTRVVLFTIIIFVLSSLYFFSPVALNQQMLKAFYWAMLLLVAVCSLRMYVKYNRSTLYVEKTKLLLAVIGFSTISAALIWNQPVLQGLRATFPYMSFALLIFLWQFKPKIEYIENLTYFFCGIYLICYFYALYMAPIPVFGAEDVVINDSRGIMRVFVPGRGFLYLTFFLLLTKYVTSFQKKWLVLASVLFVIIIMHVVRQYIVIAFIVGNLYVFRNVAWWKKLAFASLIGISIALLFENIPFLNNLLALTEKQIIQQSASEEDIRITAARYFLTDFSDSFFSKIVGNGVPHFESSYGLRYVRTMTQKHLFMSDVGFIQIFTLFGFLGLWIVIKILLACFRQQVNDRYYYAKLYILFAMSATILSDYFLNNSSIASICFAMYILDFSQYETKRKLRNERHKINAHI